MVANFYVFYLNLLSFVLELIVLRELSVTLVQSMAFMVVPLAFFASSISFVVVASSSRLTRFISCRSLDCTAIGLLVASIAVWGFRPVQDSPTYALIILAVVALAFFIWGLVLAAWIGSYAKTSLWYFWGSAGALMGSTWIYLLEWVNTGDLARVFPFLAAVPLVAMAAVERRKIWQPFAAIGLLALVFFFEHGHDGSRALHTYTNSYSQIVVEKVIPGHGFIGERLQGGLEGMLKPGSENLDLYAVYRDAHVATLVFDGEKNEDLQILKTQYPYSFLDLANKRSIAIIGTGGGQEVVQANMAGFNSITAIEINPLMIRATRDVSRNFNLIYGAPNVETVIQDARFYFRHLPAERKFDAIVLTNVRNYGGFPAAHYLSENYTLTSDAFSDYTKHLADGGLLLIRANRITDDFFKLVTDSVRLGVAQGVSGHEGQLFSAFVRHGFDDKLIGRTDGFVHVFHKGLITPILRKSLMARLKSLNPRAKARVVDVVSVDSTLLNNTLTDDRPFPRSIGGTWLASRSYPDYALLCVLVLIAFAAGGRSVTSRRGAQAAGALFCGMGYMAAEFILTDRVLFLSGSPSYGPMCAALGFLLGGCVVFGGLGQWVMRSFPKFNRVVSLALPGLLLLPLAFWFHQVATWDFGSEQFIVLGFGVSFFWSVLAALGYSSLLAMGPEASLTPKWTVALNGIGLLLGAIIAKILSMEFGMLWALVYCAGSYICAAFLSSRHAGSAHSVVS